MKGIQNLEKSNLSAQEIADWLDPQDLNADEQLKQHALRILDAGPGRTVYFRGLIEFSNICVCNCYYCGIRRENENVQRFSLTKEEITAAALWCADRGYGSVVLQAGERKDESFIAFVEDVVEEIKTRSRSDKLPNGLGITLSLGEQSLSTYQRWFAAGAHRYLLRIETTSPALFKEIHPPEQQLSTRMEALKMLREAGYQVGTGVMIGLPGQSLLDLASDILFFRDESIDMIGMGPYIPHCDAPLAKDISIDLQRNLLLALRMIALARIICRDVNIAASTALQAIDPVGREKGLLYGANVVMPLLTPLSVRKNYQLYDGKPCLEEEVDRCQACLTRRIESLGREVAHDQWGDPQHFFARRKRD